MALISDPRLWALRMHDNTLCSIILNYCYLPALLLLSLLPISTSAHAPLGGCVSEASATPELGQPMGQTSRQRVEGFYPKTPAVAWRHQREWASIH